jgi:glycine betaine/proline transport system substrate-binding protein
MQFRTHYRFSFIITAVIFLCIFTMLPFSSADAARKNVIISEQSWTGSTITCHVLKYVLEKKLDIPVKIIQLAGSATWAGLEKGDVDVFSDIWETAEIYGIEKYVQQKKVVELSRSYPNAPQGWYIPKYVADKYGIESIEDLKGKENLFDINNDGKGDLWVGPASWKVAEQNKIRITSYGLAFDASEVEQWAWLAQLKKHYTNKEPVIFYYWEPEWLFTQYELVQIKETPHDPEKWTFLKDDPEHSKITCGLPSPDIHVGYVVTLKDRLPKAYQFLKNWSIPVKEVNNLIALVTDLPGNPKLSNEQAAQKWVEEHPEILNRWLKGIK